MLSTKRDYGYFLRGFGLGAYTKNPRPGSPRSWPGDRGGAPRHEPRLQDVEVKLLGRDTALWLHFGLSAPLQGEASGMRISSTPSAARSASS